MKDLKALNISQTSCIPKESFLFKMMPVMNLSSLKMNGCQQFNEDDLRHILNYQPDLKHVEMYRCEPFGLCNVLRTLDACKNLEVFHINIKNGYRDAAHWEQLKHQNVSLDFGENVESLVKLYKSKQL